MSAIVWACFQPGRRLLRILYAGLPVKVALTSTKT